MGVSLFSGASHCPLGDLGFFRLGAMASGMRGLHGHRDSCCTPRRVFKFPDWTGLPSLVSLLLISHWPEMVTWLHPHSGAGNGWQGMTIWEVPTSSAKTEKEMQHLLSPNLLNYTDK